MFFFTYSYSFLLDMNSYWDLMQEFAGYDNPRVDWDFLTKAKLYFMVLTMAPFLMFGAVPAYIAHRVNLWHVPVHEHTWLQRHNPFHLVHDKVEDLQTWYEDRKGTASCSYCPLIQSYAFSSGFLQLTSNVPPCHLNPPNQYPIPPPVAGSCQILVGAALIPYCAAHYFLIVYVFDNFQGVGDHDWLLFVMLCCLFDYVNIIALGMLYTLAVPMPWSSLRHWTDNCFLGLQIVGMFVYHRFTNYSALNVIKSQVLWGLTFIMGTYDLLDTAHWLYFTFIHRNLSQRIGDRLRDAVSVVGNGDMCSCLGKKPSSRHQHQHSGSSSDDRHAYHKHATGGYGATGATQQDV
jgi:hypothetical protein